MHSYQALVCCVDEPMPKSNPGVEAGILGTSWTAGLEFAGVWEPLPRDLKPHGRGREFFVAIHDVCGVTNMVSDSSDGAMVNICGSAGKDGIPPDWQRQPFAGKQLDNGHAPGDPDLRQLHSALRCKVEGFCFDPGGSVNHPGYRELTSDSALLAYFRGNSWSMSWTILGSRSS